MNKSIKDSRTVQVIGDISLFLGRFLLKCLNFILTRAEEYKPLEVQVVTKSKQHLKPHPNPKSPAAPVAESPPPSQPPAAPVAESPPPSQPTAFEQWFDGKGYAVRCPEAYPSRCVKGEFNVGFCVKKKEICLESWHLSGMGNTENVQRVHPIRVDLGLGQR
jgi:hypothetical protein